eukprot:809079-Prymnesium_polylepis.1
MLYLVRLRRRAAAARRCGLGVGPDERVHHPRHRRMRRDVNHTTLLLCLIEARAERKPTPAQRG